MPGNGKNVHVTLDIPGDLYEAISEEMKEAPGTPSVEEFLVQELLFVFGLGEDEEPGAEEEAEPLEGSA